MLSRFVAALGGALKLVADFGDEQLKLASHDARPVQVPRRRRAGAHRGDSSFASGIDSKNTSTSAFRRDCDASVRKSREIPQSRGLLKGSRESAATAR